MIGDIGDKTLLNKICPAAPAFSASRSISNPSNRCGGPYPSRCDW
jgi:hypothetical protein